MREQHQTKIMHFSIVCFVKNRFVSDDCVVMKKNVLLRQYKSPMDTKSKKQVVGSSTYANVAIKIEEIDYLITSANAVF